MNIKRYNVRAWGHQTMPDIDMECDNVPVRVNKYPAVSVTLQWPIPLSLIKSQLAKETPFVDTSTIGGSNI